MFSYGRLRSIFAFAFPLFLAILYTLIGFYYYQSHQTRQAEQVRQHWRDQAALMVSRVRSEYSTSLQVEKCLRSVVENVAKFEGI
ncbi:MAG: hypothetical protein KKB51_08690 [Candidatus Riflebacteria bacterium]|nr:hypothetical protein [Candidatus Riflebacteria bacterium]